MPQPTFLQYAIAVLCPLPPFAAGMALLLRPSHPWRIVFLMLGTIIGLLELIIGVVVVIVAILLLQAYLRGTFPYFW